MPTRLFELYQRKRIININTNILTAGFLAVIIAKYPVVLIGRLIGEENKFLITLAAGGIDMVIDVILYYALHWVANHWNPPWKKAPMPSPDRSFFRDASLIQFERAILSPLYYLIAMGSMYALQHLGWSHGWAFFTAFACALVITRIVHTTWGLHTGRFRDIL